jgi:hypothetical protein
MAIVVADARWLLHCQDDSALPGLIARGFHPSMRGGFQEDWQLWMAGDNLTGNGPQYFSIA